MKQIMPLFLQMHFINRIRQVSLKVEQNSPEHYMETAGLHLDSVTFAQIYYNQTIKWTERKYTRSASERKHCTLRYFKMVEMCRKNNY